MVDFSKLSRPKSVAAPVDPIEIFKKTPNLGNAPNDLWKGQAEALSTWNAKRKDEDNAIILNTGAGKSIVGILIAQSLHNEGVGPVVYVCSTIDLVKQTERECQRIGIECTVRAGGKFSNDLFDTSRAFCITTYAALFAPISAFVGARAPAAVIFDDAHVAERLVRDSFTLSIAKSDHPGLYAALVGLLRPDFADIGKADHLDFILEDVGQARTTLCPPMSANRHAAEIIQLLKQAEYKKYEDLFFPTVQLYEHIGSCAILISSSSIEITPPFIPTSHFPFLGNGVRRVYLSATLDYQSDFVRAFGRSKVNRIEPDNDAGNGERLILLGGQFAHPLGQRDIASRLSAKNKVLVSVPSYSKAADWSALTKPPAQKDFSAELQAFRVGKAGMFCLVSRVDGIDLPQDTCRIMIMDGAPTGASLIERYQFESLGMSNLYSTKLAGRITQLFGRINRGRSDYGAFLVYGTDVNIWLRNDRNIALLPVLLRKQIILGQSLQKDMGLMDQDRVVEVVNGILGRDSGWLQFYRDTIDGLEVGTEAVEKVREREASLSIGAAAEAKYMSKMWEKDLSAARDALLDVLNEVAMVDTKLAGWYSLWIGMTYELEGDFDAGGMHYARARSRLSRYVNVPHKAIFAIEGGQSSPKTPIHHKLLFTNDRGPQALGHLANQLRTKVDVLIDASATTNQHEEALREVGELLGFEATRPDNEVSAGPDVVWIDEESKVLVPFELKTKKEAPFAYNKEEVGQSLNHLEWLKENYPGRTADGLLIVGEQGECSSNASPGDRLFLVSVTKIRGLVHQIAAKIEDTKGTVALERWHRLNELGQLPEWQAEGWLKQLAETRLKDLQK